MRMRLIFQCNKWYKLWSWRIYNTIARCLPAFFILMRAHPKFDIFNFYIPKLRARISWAVFENFLRESRFFQIPINREMIEMLEILYKASFFHFIRLLYFGMYQKSFRKFQFNYKAIYPEYLLKAPDSRNSKIRIIHSTRSHTNRVYVYISLAKSFAQTYSTWTPQRFAREWNSVFVFQRPREIETSEKEPKGAAGE